MKRSGLSVASLMKMVLGFAVAFAVLTCLARYNVTVCHLPAYPEKYSVQGSRVVRTTSYPDGRKHSRCDGYYDAGGWFVEDGVFELWNPNGTRSQYGYYRAGKHEGLKFFWDKNGRLTMIDEYKIGDYAAGWSNDLESHPAYETGRKLAAEP
jgi:hypothetical protein